MPARRVCIAALVLALCGVVVQHTAAGASRNGVSYSRSASSVATPDDQLSRSAKNKFATWGLPRPTAHATVRSMRSLSGSTVTQTYYVDLLINITGTFQPSCVSTVATAVATVAQVSVSNVQFMAQGPICTCGKDYYLQYYIIGFTVEQDAAVCATKLSTQNLIDTIDNKVDLQIDAIQACTYANVTCVQTCPS